MNKINELLKKIGKFTSIPFIFAFLGSIGGSQNSSKAIRRFGIPVIVFLLSFIKTINLFPQNLWLLTIFSMSGFLSMGYGIPDYMYYYTGGDEGSTIGRFWYNIFNRKEGTHNTIGANILTRGTIGLCICVSLLSIPYIISNWVSYFLGVILIMFGYTTVSWRDLGRIKLGKYDLCNSDNINYGLMGYAIYLMIFTQFGV